VHATQQIIHFDTITTRTEHAWTFGTNANMRSDISVLWTKQVNPDFHARFSATARTYRYLLLNESVRPAILKNAVGWYPKPLDIELMQQATQHLLGEHDFSSFQGADCQAKHPVRTMDYFNITRHHDFIMIEVKANAFLLHMVRNLIGTLIEIGNGSKPPQWMLEVLKARDRRRAGVTVIPNGLYLVAVDYPQHFDLPKMDKGPFFII
jgi:tRNA pseudouridine38-40 synthase